MADNTETLIRQLLIRTKIEGGQQWEKVKNAMRQVNIQIGNNEKQLRSLKAVQRQVSFQARDGWEDVAKAVLKSEDVQRAARQTSLQGWKTLGKGITDVVGSVTRAIQSIPIIGAAFSFSKALTGAVQYNKTMAEFAMRMQVSGNATKVAMDSMKRLSAQTGFTKQQTAKFYMTMSAVPLTSLNQTQSVLKKIHKITGANTDAANGYLSVIQKISKAFLGLDASNLRQISDIADLMGMTGQLDLSQVRGARQLATGNNQSGVGSKEKSFDIMAKNMIQQNVSIQNFFGELRTDLQTLQNVIGQKLIQGIQYLKDLYNWVKSNNTLQKIYDLISPHIGTIAVAVGGMFLLFKTAKGIASVAGGISDTYKQGTNMIKGAKEAAKAWKEGRGISGVKDAIVGATANIGETKQKAMWVRSADGGLGKSVSELNMQGGRTGGKLEKALGAIAVIGAGVEGARQGYNIGSEGIDKVTKMATGGPQGASETEKVGSGIALSAAGASVGMTLMAAGITAMGFALPAAIAGLVALSAPIAAVIVVLAGLVIAGKSLYDTWQTFSKNGKTLVQNNARDLASISSGREKINALQQSGQYNKKQKQFAMQRSALLEQLSRLQKKNLEDNFFKSSAQQANNKLRIQYGVKLRAVNEKYADVQQQRLQSRQKQLTQQKKVAELAASQKGTVTQTGKQKTGIPKTQNLLTKIQSQQKQIKDKANSILGLNKGTKGLQIYLARKQDEEKQKAKLSAAEQQAGKSLQSISIGGDQSDVKNYLQNIAMVKQQAKKIYDLNNLDIESWRQKQPIIQQHKKKALAIMQTAQQAFDNGQKQKLSEQQMQALYDKKIQAEVNFRAIQRAGTQIQTQISKKQSENIDLKNKMTQSVTSKVIAQNDFALGQTQRLVALDEQRMNLVDNLGGGVRASIQMRQRVLEGLQKQKSIVQSNISNLNKVITATNSSDKDKKDAQNELINQQSKKLSIQQKQLQVSKALRDGWISAVTAQTIGSGRITKLMVSGTQNMRQGLDSFNSLVSSQSGTTLKRSGNRAGFTAGTQIQANADGTVKYSGQQGGMAYRPSVGPDIDAVNNQFKNLRQTSLQYKTGMQAQVVTTEKLTTNFDKLGTVLTNVADGMIKSFGIGGATVSGVNPGATGAFLSGMSPALPSIVQQGGPLSQGGNVNINVTITGGGNSEEIGKQITNKLKEVIAPMFNKSR